MQLELDAADVPNHLKEFFEPVPQLKPKDLVGIPFRVAFALQDAGWYLRSDIIWAKPNCMPESVTDRPTRSHEYLFLLTKKPTYYYDADAIREQWADDRMGASGAKSLPYSVGAGRHDTLAIDGKKGLGVAPSVQGRNRRTVWTVPTSPYSGAHFATFPEKLIEPCILAGTSPQACEHCGAPWQRVVERANGEAQRVGGIKTTTFSPRSDGNGAGGYYPMFTTTGWQPTCRCENTGAGRCVVLDPFAGSGTTARVALRYQRRAILCELNADYLTLQEERTNGVQVSLLAGVL